MSKLQFYGVNGKAKQWFESYLNNIYIYIYQRTQVLDEENNQTSSSSWGKITDGVPRPIFDPYLYCGVAHTHGNVRVDLERSSRCFGRKEELDVVTRTRALDVRVGLVRFSRCFERKEELDVVTRALNVCVGLVRSSCCFGQNEELDVILAHAHLLSALALLGPVVMAVKRH
jgi:hypothetical protein